MFIVANIALDIWYYKSSSIFLLKKAVKLFLLLFVVMKITIVVRLVMELIFKIRDSSTANSSKWIKIDQVATRADRESQRFTRQTLVSGIAVVLCLVFLSQRWRPCNRLREWNLSFNTQESPTDRPRSLPRERHRTDYRQVCREIWW